MDKGVCIFNQKQWNISRIDLVKLGSDIQLNSHDNGSKIKFSRAVVIGDIFEERISFFQLDKLNIKNSAIREDYCNELAKCSQLEKLLDILKLILPRPFLENKRPKILVELIDRQFENTEGIPPHSDGTSYLFFLVMCNTMEGGDLLIYSSTNNVPNGKLPDGSECYAAESSERLATLKCNAGNGYLIEEKRLGGKPKIWHGCKPWKSSKEPLNKRKSLRIAFYSED
ncbi:hypothetical protein ACD631_16280 [Alteromonas macleodii]|uniref:hypothetical protein n=1 Tax=Alteromonas macleodii TaxID=28108 RepID=UPI0036F48FB4